ncbi:alkaline shock response membrane anchor protein AmaP [Streptomyces sp. NBC_01304]|uniref:alkaline shock response membrane anchor protein AmaP n=1 Tax=Streptomyces sp. NBC_01304 TaxID=2903818 RepID=UPI002E12DED6|nr:alkaline shock response membrane anchor protein AmaP [Streptomyces sp. NBC_01304]
MLTYVNRVLLGLLGLALVVLGGAALAAGLGVAVPSWWAWDGQGDVLLSAADRASLSGRGWWWPVVFAVLGAVLLLAVWWVVAQVRRGRLAEVLVDSGDGQGALLRGSALEGVLAGEAEGLDGVRRAQVALTGRRSAPEAGVSLWLEAHAEPADVLYRVSAEAVAQARDSAGLERLPAEVRMRAVRHRAARVN